MKILNIILSVFIFLFAAASAVFSYFLFEKRAQFVSGHEKMARAIYESSKALDAGSGTEEAKKLDSNALAHDKYENLDSALKVLPKQSAAIIAQRDSMADTIFRIGKSVGVKSENAEEYKKIDGADDRANDVTGAVTTVVNNRTYTYNAVVALSEKYVKAKPVRIEALKRAASEREAETVLSPLDGFIKKTVASNTAYSKAMSNILKTVGGKGSNDIANVQKAVSSKVAEISKLRKDLKAAKAAEDGAIAAKNRAEKSAKAAAAKTAAVRKELDDYKKRVGVSKSFKKWTKEEALERLNGRVTGVSKDYGFFVVNLGKTSVVYQNDPQDPNKKTDITLELAEDMEIVILRPTAETADPNSWFDGNGAVINSVELAAKEGFVGSSKLVKIGEKESVIELPHGVDVKVGDVVLYKKAAK